MKFCTLTLAVFTLLTMTCSAVTYTNIDFPGATTTSAHGINTAGDIVGNYTLGTTSEAFLLTGGTYTTLTFPGSTGTWANGINDSGEIVGYFRDSNLSPHGFSYVGGIYTQIDAPSSIWTEPYGVNNSGQIAGLYEDLTGNVHGFIDNGGVFAKIDSPRTNFTELYGINNNGDTVGLVSVGSANTLEGFLLHNNHFRQLYYPFSLETLVNGVNDSLELTGTATTKGRYYAFSWTSGRFSILNPPGQSGKTEGWGVNNNGFVVGDYFDTASVQHGFLMTP